MHGRISEYFVLKYFWDDVKRFFDPAKYFVASDSGKYFTFSYDKEKDKNHKDLVNSIGFGSSISEFVYLQTFSEIKKR